MSGNRGKLPRKMGIVYGNGENIRPHGLQSSNWYVYDVHDFLQ